MELRWIRLFFVLQMKRIVRFFGVFLLVFTQNRQRRIDTAVLNTASNERLSLRFPVGESNRRVELFDAEKNQIPGHRRQTTGVKFDFKRIN